MRSEVLSKNMTEQEKGKGKGKEKGKGKGSKELADVYEKRAALLHWIDI